MCTEADAQRTKIHRSSPAILNRLNTSCQLQMPIENMLNEWRKAIFPLHISKCRDPMAVKIYEKTSRAKHHRENNIKREDFANQCTWKMLQSLHDTHNLQGILHLHQLHNHLESWKDIATLIRNIIKLHQEEWNKMGGWDQCNQNRTTKHDFQKKADGFVQNRIFSEFNHWANNFIHIQKSQARK